MWYIIGQVLICLLLTAVLGVLAGWLARGYHARAELASMQRQLQRQARDLRNRAAPTAPTAPVTPPAPTPAPRTSTPDADSRAQQQLRHQLVRLQGQVEQREKEIAYLRQVIGDQRPDPPATKLGADTNTNPRQRKPG